MVAQMWLNVMSNIHCLSCYIQAWWWFRKTETCSLLIVHKYTDVLDGDLTDYLLIRVLKFNHREDPIQCPIVLHFPSFVKFSFNKHKQTISVPQSLNGTKFIPSVMKIRQMGQNFTQVSRYAFTHRWYNNLKSLIFFLFWKKSTLKTTQSQITLLGLGIG